MKNILLEQLKEIKELKVRTDVPLKDFTTFKVGGPADIFLTPETDKALQKTLNVISDVLDKSENPFFVLGKGSNIIASDRGYRGIIIYTGQLETINIQDNLIEAGCGITLHKLALLAKERGLSGLEFAAGIPGTLGGGIYMNAGAYGQEMKNQVLKAHLLDFTGQKIVLNRDELKFSYRSSILQEKPLIVTRAVLKLEKKDKAEIASLMNELNQKRREKQPLRWPSAGSIFKRPPGHYTGPLIEKAGLKGTRVGDAVVSKKHAGFIINRGNATTADIYELITLVQKKVYEMSGIKLEVEPRFIGDFSDYDNPGTFKEDLNQNNSPAKNEN